MYKHLIFSAFMSDRMINTAEEGIVCPNHSHIQLPEGLIRPSHITSTDQLYGKLLGVESPFRGSKDSVTCLTQIQTMESNGEVCKTLTALQTASTNVVDHEVRICSRNASFRAGTVDEKTFEEILNDTGSEEESEDLEEQSSSSEEDDELPTEGRIILSPIVQILHPPKSHDGSDSDLNCSFEDNSIPYIAKPNREFFIRPLEAKKNDATLAEAQSPGKQAAESAGETDSKLAYYKMLISQAQNTLPHISCEQLQQFHNNSSDDFFGSFAKETLNLLRGTVVQCSPVDSKPYGCQLSKTEPQLVPLFGSSMSLQSGSNRFASGPRSKALDDSSKTIWGKEHTLSFGLESPTSLTPVHSRKTGS